MRSPATSAEPLFELTGIANRIDLSAWLSGVSFGFGLMLCEPVALANGLLTAGPGLYVCLTAFAVFLVSVLIIQRHMQLSVMANTFGSPRQLVTSGIFQYSRNPIYVAFFIPLASIGYFSFAAAIVSTAFYIAAMNLTVIRKEERDLKAAFGTHYQAWMQSTPRWII